MKSAYILSKKRVQTFIHTGNTRKYCFKIQFVMKKIRPLSTLLVTFGVAYSSPAFCQSQCNLLQANIYKASKGA